MDKSGTRPPGEVITAAELSGTSLEKEFGLPYDSLWVLPERVEIVGDLVRWWFPGGPKQRVGSKGMLEAFIRLADSRGVERFVKKYGPLGLCAGHGFPKCMACLVTSRGPLDGNAYYERLLTGVPLLDGAYKEERVDGYLLFSRVARAMLYIGVQLRQNNPGSDADWRTLWEWGMFEPRLWVEIEGLWAIATYNWGDRSARAGPLLPMQMMEAYLGIREQACCTEAVVLLDGRLLADFLNTWLLRGQTTPVLDREWVTGGVLPDPRVRLGGTGFGRIGMRLLATIVGADLAVCDGCLQVYERYVSAARTNANFCPRCHEDGTKERIRKRKYRSEKPPKRQRALDV
ncbi:hypothetical protein [Tepidiforma thermophila]|uniref:Uncharacterized protein n=1 Tax=Tepidiforma thermophila (strain KCTC 52669 / CGMCC 1.13589 / G233) TaxID=2761530 RepID=A0A2A9HH00_TEPT2|nr:hypothetical protein [Tepidiforma thermophila]PFG75307.1 hypothetical protein A9A59_2575 [Tepidiforma thermophila]